MKEKITTIRVHMNKRDAVETLLHALDKDFRNREGHIIPNGEFEIWRNDDVYTAYGKIFGDSLKEYNDKQKRRDRRIEDAQGDAVAGYIQQVMSCKRGKRTRKVEKICDDGQKVEIGETTSTGTRLVYEFILSAGNCDKTFDEKGQVVYDNTGHEIHRMRIPAEVSKRTLRAFTDAFEDMYPHLKICYASYHADEFYMNDKDIMEFGVEHEHLGVIPVATGYKRGMSKQQSITKALKQMGFVDGRDDTGTYHNAYWYLCDDMQKKFEDMLQKEYNQWLRENNKEPELLIVTHPVRGKNKPCLSSQQFRELKDIEAQKRKRDALIIDIEDKTNQINTLQDALEEVRRDTKKAEQQKQDVIDSLKMVEEHARENLMISMIKAEKEHDEKVCRLAAEELYMEEEVAHTYNDYLFNLNRCKQSVQEMNREVDEYIKTSKEALKSDIPIDIVAKDGNIRAWMECQKTTRCGRDMTYLEAYKFDVAEAVRLDKKKQLSEMKKEQKKRADDTEHKLTESEKRIKRDKRLKELGNTNPVAEYFNKYGEDYQR